VSVVFSLPPALSKNLSEEQVVSGNLDICLVIPAKFHVMPAQAGTDRESMGVISKPTLSGFPPSRE
jgi:hypothetical protein